MKAGTTEYRTLHRWVECRKGKARKCSDCGSTTRVQWANISHEYHKDVNDYKELCAKCHGLYDRGTHRHWKWSEEAKARHSAARKGLIPWNKGKKLTAAHRAALRGPRPSIQGVNNPRWTGGQSGGYRQKMKRLGQLT